MRPRLEKLAKAEDPLPAAPKQGRNRNGVPGMPQYIAPD
jgi:hypothetical protein